MEQTNKTKWTWDKSVRQFHIEGSEKHTHIGKKFYNFWGISFLRVDDSGWVDGCEEIIPEFYAFRWRPLNHRNTCNSKKFSYFG